MGTLARNMFKTCILARYRLVAMSSNWTERISKGATNDHQVPFSKT